MKPARQIVVALGISVALMPVALAVLSVVVIATLPGEDRPVGHSSPSVVAHLNALGQE